MKNLNQLKQEIANEMRCDIDTVNDLLKLNTKRLSEAQYRHHRDFNDRMASAYGKLIAAKAMGA